VVSDGSRELFSLCWLNEACRPSKKLAGVEACRREKLAGVEACLREKLAGVNACRVETLPV
jgi:hypothetical protein